MAVVFKLTSYDAKTGLNKAMFRHDQIAGYVKDNNRVLIYLVNNSDPITIIKDSNTNDTEFDKIPDILDSALLDLPL